MSVPSALCVPHPKQNVYADFGARNEFHLPLVPGNAPLTTCGVRVPLPISQVP